jgi:hypothetical protein
MVLSLLKGMSEAIWEYVKGGGSPTDGVDIAGVGGRKKGLRRETIDPLCWQRRKEMLSHGGSHGEALFDVKGCNLLLSYRSE